MKVKRIVSNIAASDVEKARVFYKEILDLRILMDPGWIRTYSSDSEMTIQISVMSDGKPSVVNVSQVLTLDRILLTKRVRLLSQKRMLEVDQGLRAVLGL